MKKLGVLLIVAVVFIGMAVVVEAAPKNKNVWKVLGERQVTDRIDNDVISVTADRGEWRAIKITVSKRPVQFHKVTIHFANGKTQKVAMKSVIPAGGSSRVIDLDGGHRVIKKIVFRYDAQSLGGKAKVKVLGKR